MCITLPRWSTICRSGVTTTSWIISTFLMGANLFQGDAPGRRAAQHLPVPLHGFRYGALELPARLPAEIVARLVGVEEQQRGLVWGVRVLLDAHRSFAPARHDALGQRLDRVRRLGSRPEVPGT